MDSTKKELTVEQAHADFKRAYRAKRKLIEREIDDFKFALGEQWSEEEKSKLESLGINPITDNRIAPLLFLVTGLQRQNRTDPKAFPEGEEDSLKAEIASALFKHTIKTSDFAYKFSDQFKNGITCGESYLELYLDYTENLLNGKPCWKELTGNCVFPDPTAKEYDSFDGRYIYKVTYDLTREELLSLYPDKASEIENIQNGKLDIDSIGGPDKKLQTKDYPKYGGNEDAEETDDCFDLIERYYKKWVPKAYIGDYKTGSITEADNLDKAESVVNEYKMGIQAEQDAYNLSLGQYQASLAAFNQIDENGQPIIGPMSGMGVMPEPPIAPEPRDPNRLRVIKKSVPEIWCFAYISGMQEPLADERAWFFPKWKRYPLIPYKARYSTAPLTGDDSHLLTQGIVYPSKDVQALHNKSQILMIRHLNSSTNSGWLTEEDSWVDRAKVEQSGSNPAVNLEYRKGSQKPERIYPMAISQAHAALTESSAEAIKAQTGINADLLAAQEGGTDSGRAIALRTRQGLVMVQEMFDNASRTNQMAGKFMLSQLGSIYDTETAKKVLGDAFLMKNFPAPTILNEQTLQEEPIPDPATGQPMKYDKEMAEVAIAEVLGGDLGNYDVSVGEAVASETMKIANSMELKDFAATYPGLIPPDILIEESQLPQSTKNKVMSAIKQAQAMAQATVAQAAQNPQSAPERHAPNLPAI